jgi:hypothetical protein
MFWLVEISQPNKGKISKLATKEIISPTTTLVNVSIMDPNLLCIANFPTNFALPIDFWAE